MSTHSTRGRSAGRRSRSPLPVFYIILGVIALAGVTALAVLVLRDRSLPPVVTESVPLTAPVGQTEDGFYYKGQPDAPVTVYEYADFQCPGCGFFATRLEPEITRDYVNTGKVRFIFHDYPLVEIHANAMVASEAARCAGAQNAFWPMHDMLFANQSQWENSRQPVQQFGAYAEQLKLDRSGFEQCMATNQFAQSVEQARLKAEQAQIPGTPTLQVNGQVAEPTKLREAIDAALAAQE